MKSRHRPSEPPDDLRFVLRLLVVSAATFVLLYSCSGCASAGDAGFRELSRQNAKERTALKATALHSERIERHANSIGVHAVTAEKFARMLAATKLTEQQAGWLDRLRVELRAVQADKAGLLLENGSLRLQLGEIKTIADQRDATIRQTRAEVHAALNVAWWLKYKLGFFGLLLGFFGGGVVAWLLRASIRAALVAAAVYCQPLAVLSHPTK